MFKKRVAKQQQILNLNETEDNRTSRSEKNKQHNEEQQLQRQQPQKKIKPDYPSSVLASSSTQNRQKKQAELHKQFKSLNYTATQGPLSSQEEKSFVKQQLLLEEQLAKRKYLQNVNITKEIKEGNLDTTVYRGKNNYANYALTLDQINNAQQFFRKRQGPSRVNSTIRNTCRFDYNFGLCKDWHDSGYCPFGDSCIYLHDRSNYKTGWEQEKDFQRAEKERWRRISNPELAAKQDLQEALKSIEKYKVNETCQKCKKQFKSPVQVQCGHLFCSSCAITMSKCVQCKKSLSGIMNNTEKKIKKMKQTYEDMKAKILKEQQQNKTKRKKYDDIQSQDVFAD